MKRTFNIERVYHQLMKSRDVPREKLSDVVSALASHDFIELHLQGKDIRYSENEKLTDRQHKRELFKLLERVKRGKSTDLKQDD